METIHKATLKARMEKEKKKWIAVVQNGFKEDGKEFGISTNFYSESETFENILHKVELDLMTNLHNGFVEPIEIRIKEV